MPNPPTALPLVAPLGLLEPKGCRVRWLALSIACLIASMKFGRCMDIRKIRFTGSDIPLRRRCDVLMTRQVAIFILFGLVFIFPRLYLVRRPFSLAFLVVLPAKAAPFSSIRKSPAGLNRALRELSSFSRRSQRDRNWHRDRSSAASSNYLQTTGSRRPDLDGFHVSIALRLVARPRLGAISASDDRLHLGRSLTSARPRSAGPDGTWRWFPSWLHRIPG